MNYIYVEKTGGISEKTIGAKWKEVNKKEVKNDSKITFIFIYRRIYWFFNQ